MHVIKGENNKFQVILPPEDEEISSEEDQLGSEVMEKLRNFVKDPLKLMNPHPRKAVEVVPTTIEYIEFERILVERILYLEDVVYHYNSRNVITKMEK